VRESLPAEDGSVEDSLVTDVMRECDAKGVDRQVGLKVLNTLLAESKRVQGLQGKTVLVTPDDDLRKRRSRSRPPEKN